MQTKRKNFSILITILIIAVAFFTMRAACCGGRNLICRCRRLVTPSSIWPESLAPFYWTTTFPLVGAKGLLTLEVKPAFSLRRFFQVDECALQRRRILPLALAAWLSTLQASGAE